MQDMVSTAMATHMLIFGMCLGAAIVLTILVVAHFLKR